MFTRSKLALCAVVVGAALIPLGATDGLRPQSAAAATQVDLLMAPIIKTVKKASVIDFLPATKASRTFLAGRLLVAQQQADAGICGDALPPLRAVEDAATNSAANIRIVPPLGPALLPQLLGVEAVILASGSASGCGGVRTPQAQPPAPVSAVTSSDIGQVQISFLLPAVHFGHIADPTGTQDFLTMAQPGVGHAAGVLSGAPDLPAVSALVAMPAGTWPEVSILSTSKYSMTLPEPLAPLQESAPAVATTDVPLATAPDTWSYNADAYRSTTSQPDTSRMAQTPYVQRGLQLVAVSVPVVSYIPASNSLQVAAHVDIQVKFCGDQDHRTCIPNGSTGTTSGVSVADFGSTDLVGASNAPFINLWQNQVVNWNQVASSNLRYNPRTACGEKMMLITDPAYADLANTYAAARTDDGVVTKVFSTLNISASQQNYPVLRDAIAATIASEVATTTSQHCAWVPSYVLFFGNTTQVPTFEVNLPYAYAEVGQPAAGTCVSGGAVATDQPYGYVDQWGKYDSVQHTWSTFNQDLRGTEGAGCRTTVDLVPDLFIGRIITPSTSTINKLIAYNDHPPTAKATYASVTGASFFQTSLSNSTLPNIPNATARATFCTPQNAPTTTQAVQDFVRSSEFAANLATVAGKSVQRVYVDSDQCPGYTPKTYVDGTSLPAILLNPAAWQPDNGASQADILAKADLGSPIMWHADHGWSNSSGWAQPYLVTSALNHVLPPGILPPVLWSTDCDTGKYDGGGGQAYVDQSPYNFSDAALKGMAVAHVGASRESPTGENHVLLESTARALYPELGNIWLAILGIQPRHPVEALGPLLQAAKNDVMARVPTSWGAPLVSLEYNLFGDPSMSLRRDAPTIVSLKKIQFTASVSSTSGAATVQVSTGTAKVPARSSAMVEIIKDGVVLGDCYGSFANCPVTLYPTATGSGAPADLIHNLNGATLVVSADGMVPVTKVLTRL